MTTELERWGRDGENWVPLSDGYWTPWHLADAAIRYHDDSRQMDLKDRHDADVDWEVRYNELVDECRALEARLWLLESSQASV